MAKKIVIETTDPFEQDFADLSEQLKARVRKALKLFVENPRHPSLQVKKMRGFENIWEARVSQHHRITFTIIKGKYYLRHVGPHDIEKNP